jgi:DNA recombination protein RmuC
MLTALLVLVALVAGLVLGAWLATRRAHAGSAALRDAFTAVSTQALRENNEAFLALAGERLATQEQGAQAAHAHRDQAVAALLAPVQESLRRVDEQLGAIESSRQRAYGGLLEQVEGMRRAQADLRKETAQLVTALRAPQTRGRWGELQLRRVVEAAGMVEHVHFEEQVSVAGAHGEQQRPDLLVHLADGKQVVVDAKVSLAAWLEAMEAPDDARRDDRMRAHARHLREHVQRLSAKDYWRAFDTSPEFVVLFVPADTFLDAALQQDPMLLEDAFAADIVLATPSTLVALLRTVGYCWRTERLAANAQQISTLAAELYGRLGTVGDHLDRLGSSLGRAVGAYNQTVGSLESRVFVTARRLADLQVSTDPLPTPQAVHEGIRPLTAPELTQRAG